jgi:hypothetical protein
MEHDLLFTTKKTQAEFEPKAFDRHLHYGALQNNVPRDVSNWVRKLMHKNYKQYK